MDEKIAVAYHSGGNDILTNPKVKATNLPVPLRPEPVKSESRSSPDQEEMESEYVQVGAVNKNKDQSEHRSSPGTFIPIKGDEMNETMGEDNNSEEGQPVDDISMSPLPYDHEDPVSLMMLPDDILNLPISPCGPHDDPAQA